MPLVLYPASVGVGQGDTGGPRPGSGLAVPGGVESTFEFNTLLLNYRRWWDTYIVSEIDGLDGADIRDARDINPGFHGETAFDSFYAGRTIVMTGKIRAYSLSKMRDLEMALRAALGDLKEHQLIVRSGNPATDVMIPCKTYQKPTIKEAQSDFNHVRDFQITLRAADPFFYSYIENYAPVVMAASPTSVSVANKGNFEARPRIKIVGPLTNPVVLNTTNGKSFTLNGTIIAGSTWEVDAQKRTVVDQNGNNIFGALDVTSEWVTLDSGDNNLQITASAITPGGSAMQVFWRDTWV